MLAFKQLFGAYILLNVSVIDFPCLLVTLKWNLATWMLRFEWIKWQPNCCPNSCKNNQLKRVFFRQVSFLMETSLKWTKILQSFIAIQSPLYYLNLWRRLISLFQNYLSRIICPSLIIGYLLQPLNFKFTVTNYQWPVTWISQNKSDALCKECLEYHQLFLLMARIIYYLYLLLY